MNKNISNFIATLVLAGVLSLFLPWWSVMAAALITALWIPLKKAAVFFIPFLAVCCYWMGYCFLQSSANDFTLAKKISQLLQIGGNPYILIVVTGLIGGIAAGVAGVFGRQLRALGNH